ncbi:hypothetical protein [Pseudomonas spirodelae]|uniref:Uncharacterized protein n=1 Tax=Pseudomonas spirodelae TaxID=3101751 RepID=A0ABU5P541_9PSED|nr:hypothetical protein [Pseudomonas sp. T5W1]MBU0900911.1 hypothetical protein [Gammaproteobacteria bacterium]MEA1604613.1 hypothetical protein [Pseudomonas sp. T5W1]
MMRFPLIRRPVFTCLALLMLPLRSWAELPNPLNGEAVTPALHYQSPLKAYQGFSEQPLSDWPEANERVARIGGWRTYAQEPWTQPADNAAMPSAEPAATNPHSQHGGMSHE